MASKKRPANKSRSSVRNGRANLAVEHLEPRQMMTVSPLLHTTLFQPLLTSTATSSYVSAIQYQQLSPGIAAILAAMPQPTAAGKSLINGLTDPTIRATAMTDYLRDGDLTRNDMIEIIKAGSNQYTFITANEFHDLQTLVSNAATVGMPAYVQNLSNKVVNTGLAYSFYVSGLMSFSPYNPGYFTYDIIAGQSFAQQVNNWFLGTVRPDPVLRNADNTVSVNASYWQVNNLPLFAAGGPVYQDVQQGQVGDCWLLASLAEVADRNPTAIRNMFIDNGDGTYTVRFFNGGVADYVTVDNYLPGLPKDYKYITQFYSVYDHPINDMWVALAEKAYAQECASGWIGTHMPGSNSYQALNGEDPYYAMAAITGNRTSDFTITSYLVTYPTIYKISNVSGVYTAWSQGQYVVLTTPDDRPTSIAGIAIQPLQVVPDHVYAVVGYSSGTFTLFNPWGTGGGYHNGRFYAGTFTGNLDAIAANFVEWTQSSSQSAPQQNVAAAGALGTTGTKAITSSLNQTQPSVAQSADDSREAAARFEARWAADNTLLAAINLAQHRPANLPIANQPAPENVALADKFAAVDAALSEMFAKMD